MISIEITKKDIAENLCRKITVDLPEHFGLPEVNEHYIIGVGNRENLIAKINGIEIGLISIDFSYPDNCNIYWMGVLSSYQNQGIGRKLIEKVCIIARSKGAKTITVETLAPFENDENYLKTYKFYQLNGFIPLFNIKPNGYEWNMVIMLKNLETTDFVQENSNIVITNYCVDDIPIIFEAFAKINWQKSIVTLENYLQEQNKRERMIWVAHYNNKFAGYITLKWKSSYEYFSNLFIPEVMDLNVLPSFRNNGIGSKLLECAENECSKKYKIIGIGVGLYGGFDGGYGAAQKIYVKRGYIPDGKGITYNYKYINYGESFPLDDNLILWFTKKLN